MEIIKVENMKRKITDSEIIKEVEKWFEWFWNSTFITKPEQYQISIDSDDNIFIHGQWDNGTEDFCGLGNKYKFLWERGL